MLSTYPTPSSPRLAALPALWAVNLSNEDKGGASHKIIEKTRCPQRLHLGLTPLWTNPWATASFSSVTLVNQLSRLEKPRAQKMSSIMLWIWACQKRKIRLILNWTPSSFGAVHSVKTVFLTKDVPVLKVCVRLTKACRHQIDATYPRKARCWSTTSCQTAMKALRASELRRCRDRPSPPPHLAVTCWAVLILFLPLDHWKS